MNLVRLFLVALIVSGFFRTESPYAWTYHPLYAADTAPLQKPAASSVHDADQANSTAGAPQTGNAAAAISDDKLAGQPPAAVQEPDAQQPDIQQPDTPQPDTQLNEDLLPSEDKVLTQRFEKGVLIDVRGPIFASMKQYLSNRLSAAQRGGVDLIILRITSPGGELDASLELARQLSEIQWATTIAYVPEEAFSGAAIVALGCDRIYMRPRALIGDAGPIHFHGGFFEHADQKVISALAAAVHQLAAAKKRPGAIAEAMVDRSIIVHEARARETGERTYLTANDAALPHNKEAYVIGAPIPESGQDRFLTVAGNRAVQLMVAEGTFDSERQLLDSLSVGQLSQTRRTWVDRTVFVLNHPFVSTLLLLLGLLALYVEFSIPGISVAALISLLCFALFFWSHALGGTSGWLEVMLFALGVACLAIELFVLPGFGVFGLTGAAMIILSLVMASQDFVLPQTTLQWTTLRNNLLIVLFAMASLVVALIIQITFFDSVPGLGRFRLERPEPELIAGAASGGDASAFSAQTHLPQVGDAGVADSVLRPAGKVRFNDQVVDVVTEGDFLDPGTRVEVVKREGNRVIVRSLS